MSGRTPPEPRPADPPPETLSAPPTGRKAYAPDPVGKPSVPGDTPPPEVEQVPVLNYLHVTNLGTLLDVMA